MESRNTGGVPSVVAFVCLAGGIAIMAYVAHTRRIGIDSSFEFFEALMQQMGWGWAAGGFAVSIAGCVAGEKARNRGAGLPATFLVVGCLVLALGFAMILLYSAGGFARMLG
jgi:hypothetical protein